MTYTPATQDQLLAIRVNAGIEELAQSEKFAAAEPDMVEAIVGGIGEFAAGEWAPLTGWRSRGRVENGGHLPDGFAQPMSTMSNRAGTHSGPASLAAGPALRCPATCSESQGQLAFNLLPC